MSDGQDPTMYLDSMLYKQFLENIRGTVYQIVLDGENRYSIKEGRHEELTGYPKDYFTSADKFLDLIYSDDRQRVMDYDHRLHHEENFDGDITYRLQHRDGSLIWVTSYDRHYVDISGRQVIQGLIFDATERKNQEQALQDAFETIRDQMDKSRERIVLADRMENLALMVSSISHEVATPMGNARLLGSDMASSARKFRDQFRDGEVTGEDLEEFLQRVIDSSRLMDDSLDQAASVLQGFKRIAADEATVQTRSIKVDDYFRDLQNVYKPWIRKIRHEVSFGLSTTRTLTTIPGYITQIILNLVNNAAGHGFADGSTGHISISVGDEGDEGVRFAVEDNGLGIADELRERIFEPHFTTAGDEGGTGLGLGISRSLAEEKLGGTLSCEVPAGGGARFVLTLTDLEDPG